MVLSRASSPNILGASGAIHRANLESPRALPIPKDFKDLSIYSPCQMRSSNPSHLLMPRGRRSFCQFARGNSWNLLAPILSPDTQSVLVRGASGGSGYQNWQTASHVR